MRLVSAVGAVVALLVACSTSLAQVGPDIRFITVEEAEVRAGPSDKQEFYVTNRLRRGQPVEVVGEMEGGWLAIRPPEGSHSFINTRFLRHLYPDTPNHVVQQLDGDSVLVYIGSEVVNRRPTVVGARLEKGTQVRSRGVPQNDEEGSWMPIEPPARERRFLKAAHVAKKMPEPASASPVVTASAAGAPAHSTFTPSAVPSANVPQTPMQLYQQAQQAERVGQVAEAVRLYALAGAGAAQSQPSLSALALQRAQYLQGGHQNYGAGGAVAPPPASTSERPTVATTTVQVGPSGVTRGVEARPVSTLANGYTPPVTPTRGSPSTWAQPRGVLRRSGRLLEGQTTYVLDDPNTVRPLIYAIGAGNLRLDAYLGQEVELRGYAVYRGDLKNNLMIVQSVVPSR